MILKRDPLNFWGILKILGDPKNFWRFLIILGVLNDLEGNTLKIFWGSLKFGGSFNLGFKIFDFFKFFYLSGWIRRVSLKVSADFWNGRVRGVVERVRNGVRMTRDLRLRMAPRRWRWRRVRRTRSSAAALLSHSFSPRNVSRVRTWMV